MTKDDKLMLFDIATLLIETMHGLVLSQHLVDPVKYTDPAFLNCKDQLNTLRIHWMNVGE